MHYTDDFQLKNNILKIVVYKHGTTSKPKHKKNGQIFRNCVAYEIANFQMCYLFPTNLLRKILEDPYFFFNEKLTSKKFEEWYELTIKQIDWDTIKITHIRNVSNDSNDSLRLH